MQVRRLTIQKGEKYDTFQITGTGGSVCCPVTNPEDKKLFLCHSDCAWFSVQGMKANERDTIVAKCRDIIMGELFKQ